MKNFDRDFFEKHGYFLADSNFSHMDLDSIRKCFSGIYDRGLSSQYPYIRVYDDFIGKPNIAGIEMPFHKSILCNELIKFLNKSVLLNGVKYFLDEKNLFMSLSRYHVTKKFSHIGNWHTDAKISSDTIQASIFLYDEKGFELIPGSHSREPSSDESEVLTHSPFKSIKNTISLDVKEGQILFFDPAIIHRGISIEPRVNIHFRFEKSPQLIDEKSLDWIPENFNDDWKKILANPMTKVIDESIPKYRRSSGLREIFKRILRTFIHFLPLPISINSDFYKKLGVMPSMRIRKSIGLKI